MSSNPISNVSTLGAQTVEAEQGTIGTLDTTQRQLMLSVELQGDTQSTTGSPGSFVTPDKAEFESVLNSAEFSPHTVEAQLAVQSGGTMDADADYRGVYSSPNSFVELGPITVSSGNTFAFESSGFSTISDFGETNLNVQFRGDGTNTISISKATLQFFVTYE